MEHEKLLAKIFYRFEMITATPLSIGASSATVTDHDVLQNSQGPLIPATSLAGALEAYAKANHLDLFTSQAVMSKFIISDGHFVNAQPRLGIRDGIALDENKQTKDTAKYNYQVIDKDEAWTFTMEVTVREHFLAEKKMTLEGVLNEYNREAGALLSAIQSFDIRFGYKKNRGFGCMKILNAQYRTFFGASLKELIGFDGKQGMISLPLPETHSPFLTICCPLKLDSGLIIRGYSSKPNEPDIVQISAGKDQKACIPGSSLSGMLRHQMEKIEKELNPNLDFPLMDMFGTSPDCKTDPHMSRIIVDESYLEKDPSKGGYCQNTRSSVDRFSGAGLNRALYTEKAWYYGTTKLVLHIDSDETKVPKELIGLLLLAILDFSKGYCAIGGETSIGNGILLGDDIEINGKPFDKANDPYLAALAAACERK
jgi:CRISPR/Cas system CSM-associated protein Csm3 (group 7 of RAMP superfamily)